MDDRAIRRQRLASQQLAPRSTADIRAVVRAAVGLQAQDLPAVRLAIRARCARQTAATVDAVLNEGSIARTWLMRGTLHLVAAEDARWLIELFGPLLAAGGKRRRAQLGIDDPDRSMLAIQSILADGPLTRPDLFQRLNDRGISTTGQAGIHQVAYAAHHGVVCFGPVWGTEPTFVLCTDWLPATEKPADPVADLAARYLTAFGPAAVDDFIAWSGVNAAKARAGWAVALSQPDVERDGALAWRSGETPAADSVRLVGSFDNYLLGYRGRDLALPAEHTQRIYPGGGIIHPAILVDGVVRGTWRGDRIDLFGPVPADTQQAIDAEIADIQRFGTSGKLAAL